MQHKSFGKMACPIARSLERVGEWWSILIIRDVLHGFTGFDEFQKSLNIAPNMLTRRLSALVDAGLFRAPSLQRTAAALRIYSDRDGPRFSAGHHRHVHFLPYFFLNQAMRPSVSRTGCFPVKNGCDADDISTLISG